MSEKKHSELLKKKSIKQKLKTSIAEYEFGVEMLKFDMPLAESDRQAYSQLVANILFENRKEEGIDPRL